MNAITTIDFNGQSLITTEINGIHYTAIKPIAENIGLAWHGQLERIKRDEVLSEGIRIIRTPSKGGEQDTLCLPIDYLNGWLFGVDAKRVKPQIKATLIKYQKECYKALHDYWHTGAAVNPRAIGDMPSSVKDRNGLVKAARMAQKRLGLGYDETFNLIHHRFNVDRIGDLTVNQVGAATEYIQHMMLSVITNPYRGDGDGDGKAELQYHYRNNERLVSQADAQGNLWTRPLADHEFVVSTLSLPQFIHDCNDLELPQLTALSFAVSKKMVEAQAWSNVVMVCNTGEQP